MSSNQIRGCIWGTIAVLVAMDWSFVGCAVLLAMLQVAEG